MKWIKSLAILLFSVLAAAVFAVHSLRVELDSAAAYTMDPDGNLYLLSSDAVLTKVSSAGRVEWELSLPTESEGGAGIRYNALISDRSGSLFITAQEYKRQVDAAGNAEDVILSESVEAYNGDGQRQEPVLVVEKSALSQYSTESYILKTQACGDALLAVCRNGGQYEVIRVEPYGADTPAILTSCQLDLSANDVQDCAALPDGTLVISTKSGDLWCVDPVGEMRSLLSLIGEQSLIGRLSADDAGSVYLTELQSGVLYSVDAAGSTFTRLFSPANVIDQRSGLTFDQVRGTAAAGGGGFTAVSIDTESPFWVWFDTEGGWVCISRVSRGWSLMLALAAAGVLLGSAVLLWVVLRALGWLRRRSMLTGRILLHFLPVFVLVLAVGCAAVIFADVSNRRQQWDDRLGAAARTAAALLDGDVLQSADLRADGGGSQRLTLTQELDEAAALAADVSGVSDIGLILYIRQGDQYLCAYATNPRDAFYNAAYMVPLEREMPSDTVEQIMALDQTGGSIRLQSAGAPATGYFQPILTSGGETAALIEARSALPQLGSSPAAVVCMAGGAAAAVIFLWLIFVLARAFRPLQELGRCIGEISAGNWSVKARITSHDELADIGASFNQMTEKLNQYISNMVLLNNEYIKFTPRGLFQLMGKTKVTDIRLHDKSVRDVSLLYVNFRAEGAAMDSEAYFALMNEQFDRIFDLVDKNRGIIERFDGSGMTVLFPWQVRDALNTAIALKEMMAREQSAVSMKMLISADETLVGVAGNQKRQTITAISNTMMDVYALNSLMDEIGTRYVVTKGAIERVGDDYYFNYREIGSGRSGRETLYEFLDGMDTYEKKLHLVTRDEFEAGVHAFQAGQLRQARRHFVNVLQTNEKDKVAMYYLLLCDGHHQ